MYKFFFEEASKEIKEYKKVNELLQQALLEKTRDWPVDDTTKLLIIGDLVPSFDLYLSKPFSHTLFI